MRISSHIDVYEPSEDEYRLFIENSMTYVFASFRLPYLWHKYGVSTHSLVNLSKTFLRISPAQNIAQIDLNLCDTIWIFIFFFLFDSWLNLLNGFDSGVTVKTSKIFKVHLAPVVQRMDYIIHPLYNNWALNNIRGKKLLSLWVLGQKLSFHSWSF